MHVWRSATSSLAGGRALPLAGKTVAQWIAPGIDLLFPPVCPICQRETEGAVKRPGTFAVGGPVCAACTAELTADVTRCGGCGAPGPAETRCHLCHRGGVPWERVWVLSAYGGGLREAVLRAKRPAGSAVAAALADLLVKKHGESIRARGIERIVPVPMHWLRQMWRGTSSADELAAEIARLLGIPFTRAVVRRKATRMQNELPIVERPHNVSSAFRLRHHVRGRRILLVDDVMTTGSTAAACCRALAAGDAAAVDVAVVARADAHGDGDDD